MTSQTIHPIEMDRVIMDLGHGVTDQDDREIEVPVWVSRSDFPGVVIEIPADADMICLNLTGAMKLRDALDDAIRIMGEWED
jgi:hypothetical protein